MGRNKLSKFKHLKRVLGAGGLTVILATVLSACSLPAFGGYKGATTQGHDTHMLYAWLVIAAIVVGGITLSLILWAVLRYRKKSDAIPKQFQYHIPLEIIYTVIPTIIVLIVFFFTVNVENKVDAVSTHPYVKIKVTAFQWGWNFDYPQLHVDVHGVTLQNPEMVLPTGKTAHSSKLNVIPPTTIAAMTSHA